ncbi:MIPT3 protein, partial [Smithornis capensis]|nr:MIPT3 protein [Smithornis capensis]
MNEAVAQRTRETLGQVIHKPPLTDALLSKPPFRYLHDLISEVIRATGFLKGLYTDSELNSDNVKDKNSKMNFLQKAIDVVVLVTGEPLSVKPARVVAGYEPEKTNEFLQAIGKCCLNKARHCYLYILLSADAAVKRVLAGERADPAVKSPSSKPRDKESRESKAEEPKNQGDKEGRRDTGIKERSSNRPGKPRGDVKEGREREKEGDEQKDNKERHKDPETDTGREEGKQERERSKSRTTKQGRDPEKSKGKGDREKDLEHDKVQERERRYEGGREKDRLKGRDKDKARDREGVRGRDGDRPRDREKDEEHLQERKKKAERKNGSPARISRQPSVKGSRHHSKTRGEGEWREDIVISMEYAAGYLNGNRTVDTRSGADGIPQDIGAELQEKTDSRSAEKQKGTFHREMDEVDLPFNSQLTLLARQSLVLCPLGGPFPFHCCCRRIPGPGSARPAPPRVKRQESTEISIPERSGSAKTTPNVILEQQVPEEEDEQFVVEAAGPLPQMVTVSSYAEKYLDFLTGGLIKRILETKKDYEASQMTDREHHIVLGPSRKRERDLVAREVQKCQVAIQTVCRHAAAFGRILDCIQEDMDAMKNELHMWKQENKQLEEALRREQSITDSALQPLKAELAELDQLIKDEQDKIRAVKANILRNNEKIDRMIRSINASSRK